MGRWDYIQNMRRRQDPCTIVPTSSSAPLSYDMAKTCLDADFGFPDTLRQDTVATIKSLISNFYAFEDMDNFDDGGKDERAELHNMDRESIRQDTNPKETALTSSASARNPGLKP